eukprot:106846-Amphidinium_carterae.1
MILNELAISRVALPVCMSLYVFSWHTIVTSSANKSIPRKMPYTIAYSVIYRYVRLYCQARIIWTSISGVERVTKPLFKSLLHAMDGVSPSFLKIFI